MSFRYYSSAIQDVSTRALPTAAVRFLVLASLQLGLPGCASIDAHTTEYVGATHLAASNPATVEILRNEPRRTHERLGEVLIDASTEPAPTIEQKLREEAAKIGGDAAVLVYGRVQPVAAVVNGPLWDRDVKSIQGRKLKAIVIHYQ